MWEVKSLIDHNFFFTCGLHIRLRSYEKGTDDAMNSPKWWYPYVIYVTFVSLLLVKIIKKIFFQNILLICRNVLVNRNGIQFGCGYSHTLFYFNVTLLHYYIKFVFKIIIFLSSLVGLKTLFYFFCVVICLAVYLLLAYYISLLN